LTLASRCCEVVHQDGAITYYVEPDQDIDRVLDIFIRTNSGGEPLGYSDLMMSSTTAQWRNRDARAAFDKLVDQVSRIGSPGFIITKDFVLKTCLALFSSNVRFRMANLNSSVIDALEQNWDRASKAIVASFEFLGDIGFNELNLRAKNPVVPIVQYVYLRGTEGDFAKPQTYPAEKAAIRTWLCMSILAGVFRSQTDHTLNTLGRLVKQGAGAPTPHFPLEEIRSEFKGSLNRSLEFTDAFVADVLSTRFGDPRVFPLLRCCTPTTIPGSGSISITSIPPPRSTESESCLRISDRRTGRSSRTRRTGTRS
jgi:hypothetical protein